MKDDTRVFSDELEEVYRNSVKSKIEAVQRSGQVNIQCTEAALIYHLLENKFNVLRVTPASESNGNCTTFYIRVFRDSRTDEEIISRLNEAKVLAYMCFGWNANISMKYIIEDDGSGFLSALNGKIDIR